MRLLIALVFVLGLAFQATAQVLTVTASSVQPSSVLPSSIAPSGTGSVSGSSTGTASTTYPTPEAPVNLDNLCKGHIITICPDWQDPAGFVFDYYRVYYTVQGSNVVDIVRTTDTSIKITNLVAGSLYDVWVQGRDANGVWSLNSTTITMNTDPADPKKDPTRDISAFTCTQTTNAKNNRNAAVCSWSAALDTVRQINFKVQCVSSVREPTLVRRRVYGATAAAATSAFFAINRDIATCTFKARFYYTRRPSATRHTSVINF